MDFADTIHREKALFEQALELASAAERLAFLKGACGEHSSLLARVQALLQAHEAAEGFLPGEPAGRTTLVLVTEKPGDRIGRYKLREKIGEGGCGVVYVAEQEEPIRRRVALKVIKLGMDTRSVVARFEAERQALAMMDHPNIAKVLDAGATDTGRPYFVMELVRGIKITDYCDQNNLSTRERLDLFIQVCRAVQHAHQKGIIHRDLKPSNILVTLHDGVPVPKVIDFGIAKATEGRLTELTVYTELNQFIGTPAYMSPEQAEMSGLDIDTRSDIYSLGVLLYELLTGKTPFAADELMRLGLDEMRRTIREKEPVRPSTRLSTMLEGELTTTAKHRALEPPRLIHLVRGDLDWIVMKSLEKDRTRRYETANALAIDLQRHLENEPIEARPPSAAYRLQKAARRYKLAFAAAGAVATALAIGVVASTWQAVLATRAKRDADAARKTADQNAGRALAAEDAANTNLQNASNNLYLANMRLAEEYWEDNNLGGVQELLKESETYSDRGFEWYYWQRLTHLGRKTLHGHTGEVQAVAVSPDGRRVVTGSNDQTARVWDAVVGRELITLTGHRAGINSVAFAPDGLRIVTGSADQTARIWDAATGKELLLLKGHVGEVRAVVFSPNGLQILTGSGDRTARIWDAGNGRELRLLEGHSRGINSAAFSADGTRIVTGSTDQTAKVWDSATGTNLFSLPGDGAEVTCVAFSPDGQRIVLGGEDGAVRMFEAATRKELATLKAPTPKTGNGKPGTGMIVEGLAFSPDGRRIVVASSDHTASVLDATSGEEFFTLKGHSDSVRSVAFSLDGHRIVTGSDDQTAKVWDADRDPQLATLQGHTGWVWSVSFSPDSRRLITGGFDHQAKVWDVASGKELFTLLSENVRNRSVAFSPDGQRMATGSDTTFRVYEAASGKELFYRKPRGGVGWLAFSLDSQRIFVSSAGDQKGDQSVKAWEAGTGKELDVLFKGLGAGITPKAISPDGQRVVTVHSGRAEVWDAASGQKLVGFDAHSGIWDPIVFSPDGQRIATGGGDNTAKVWNAVTGEKLLTLSGHRRGVETVAFSPDGKRIVTCSHDATARLWDAASGKELLTLKGHRQFVQSVAFSPDGHRIATGGSDETARIWEAATKDQVAEWQQEEAAARRSLAEQRRQQPVVNNPGGRIRAADPGAIKQWLVLAPIAFEDRTHAGTVAALASHQLAQEGQLHSRPGERVVVGGIERVWKRLQLDDNRLDFNQFLEGITEWSVAYAVCYIESDADQAGLLMRVYRDDWAKIYLNGKEIYRREDEETPDELYPDTVAGVDLQAGTNTLVFKVINDEGGWFGSVRLTDAQGNAVKGIRVTLDPEAKD
jgi:WD40 repeat protein